MILKNIRKKIGDRLVSVSEQEIPSSGITLLLGESGCGKSTLLHIISGFTPPDSGQVTGSENVSLMLQNPLDQVIMSTVMDELLFPLKNAGIAEKAAEEKAREVLELAGLAGLALRDMQSLSFGETQWIMLLATLLTPARVCCLDEPTSHMDPASIERFYTLLRRYSKNNVSFIVSSQNPDEHIYAESIWILEKDKGIRDVRAEEFLHIARGTDLEPDRIVTDNLLRLGKGGRT